jgi:aryl-alcohol dehydrogenase-like predicted oxidoreductase
MGLGCYAIGGPFTVEDGRPWGWGPVDDNESIRAIHAGLAMGINLLDTAIAYGCGHSETIIGKAVHDRRDQVVIATKFSQVIDFENKTILGHSAEPDQIRQSCEHSLRHLNTDYIDLFQWHNSDGDIHAVPAIVNVLDELIAAGKIRYYAWSTDDPERARVMATYPSCVAIQHALNVFLNAAEMLGLCETFGLASINRSPLAMGVLTGKYTEDSRFGEGDIRHSLGWDFRAGRQAERLSLLNDLRDVLTSGGRTVAQGALAWIWARHTHTIPIPGFKTVKQVEENAKAMAFGQLTAEQMAQIETIVGRT